MQQAAASQAAGGGHKSPIWCQQRPVARPHTAPVPVAAPRWVQVLELALHCGQLRAVVHISSAFVNSNHPEGTTVYERLYQLHYGNQTIDPMALAEVRGRYSRPRWSRRPPCPQRLLGRVHDSGQHQGLPAPPSLPPTHPPTPHPPPHAVAHRT
jgi:hypothetical protein